MVRSDLLFDTEGNPLFENGDFVIGDSDEQHVNHLILSSRLDFKEFPLLGANAQVHVNSENLKDFKRSILEVLSVDGYLVKTLSVDDFVINLELK